MITRPILSSDSLSTRPTAGFRLILFGCLRVAVPVWRYYTCQSTIVRKLANAWLWHRHCRQMPMAYDVEGTYERWLQNILNIC